MDRVNFLTIEFGKDLILSFSFNDDTKYGVDGYCIQRTPSLEYIVDSDERGPAVDWTDDDRVILLRKVVFDRNTISLETDDGVEKFDISEIEDEEYADMLKVLKEMNFDNSITIIENS